MILVVYVFHKYDRLVKNFIEFAMFKDDNIDFVFVCNDPNIRVYIPDYATIIYRENKGHDFGAWSEGLLTRKKDYEYYICVNSTAEGPFYNGKWTDIYVNGLKDNIKLFGSTINCCANPWSKLNPYWCGPHVQTYIFSMTHEALEYLSAEGIFSLSEYTTDKRQTIYIKEVGMSKKILDRGWNIGCLLKCYKNIDFCKPCDNLLDDVMYPHFENLYWKREELIFIKGNR